MSYMRWRRGVAVVESRALRGLYLNHGRIPAHRSTDARMDDYEAERNALRSREYRRKKKEAA